MISYIVPYYLENGDFVGVIGMDIDFRSIISEEHGVETYESGSVALVELEYRIIYYSDNNGIVQRKKLPDNLYNHMTNVGTINELLEIKDKSGDISVICCRKLCNEMIMYVNVPQKEIVSNRDYLMMVCISITVVIFVVFSIIIMRRTRRIVYPIEKLTEITKKYADGDWSCQYISNTRDEVQKLSEGISKMAKNTQQYIEELNNLARTDAVTGVGNKTSYLEIVEKIRKNENNEYDECAVVVMDLNNLKKTNDNYGHEAGDALIKEAAKYIGSVFINCPVFRTGGDEFVVILYSDAYKHRKDLINRFEEGMYYSLPDFPEIIISVSYGMAEYCEGQNEYDSVFELADERMYIKKKDMKKEREVHKMVKHIILWKLKGEITGEEKDKVKAGIKEGLEGLAGKIPGLIEIKVQTECLDSSNVDVMLESVFEDEASLKGYAVHPEHVAVADNRVRPYTAVRSCIDYQV